jgi:Chaperone of endosialidase
MTRYRAQDDNAGCRHPTPRRHRHAIGGLSHGQHERASAVATSSVGREAGKPLKSTLGIVGLVLLFCSGMSWAGGPPNPTPSDKNDNTAGGSGALNNNTAGGNNTANGKLALGSNTTGSYNTASGVQALWGNATGDFNTAVGWQALVGNGTGTGNTSVGFQALQQNTTGSNNTAIGLYAGQQAENYTNGTAIGFRASLTASNSIVLGNGSITAIYAQVSTITAISDRRRKKEIKALGSELGLDFIEKLEPVSYRFNNGDETERYGFIAQDLEQALPASLHDSIRRSETERGLALIERQNDKDRTYRRFLGDGYVRCAVRQSQHHC